MRCKFSKRHKYKAASQVSQVGPTDFVTVLFDLFDQVTTEHPSYIHNGPTVSDFSVSVLRRIFPSVVNLRLILFMNFCRKSLNDLELMTKRLCRKLVDKNGSGYRSGPIFIILYLGNQFK